MVTLTSCYRTNVDFDKIYMFCDKYCVLNNKCVSFIVKIKFVNFGNNSNICNKLNFNINYTFYNNWYTFY